MSTYALPLIAPSSVSFGLESNTRVFESPFTRSRQTHDTGGEHWRYQLSYRNLTGDDRAVLIAFLTRMQGYRHRAYARYYGEANRGALTGTPLVADPDQKGNVISIDGATGSVTNWIRAGDYFQIGNELKQCVEDANSDAGGNVQITFTPRIRISPLDNSAVIVTNPRGTFMLDDNSVSWTDDPHRDNPMSNLSFVLLEDVLA